MTAAVRLFRRVWAERYPAAFDLLLAVALTVLLLLEVWFQEGANGTFANRPLSSAVLLLLTVPLIWRRRAPVAVAACHGAGRAIQAIVTGAWVASFGILLSTLIALYSAGAYAERSRAVLGLAFVLSGLTVATLYDIPANETDLWNGLFFYLLTLLVFAIGLYVRGRREAVELERHTTQLERQREEQVRAVAEERARIARELHDVVAHSVSATVVQAEAAEEVLDREPDSARRSLRRIQRTGREALGEMRALLGIMREGSPEGLGPQPGIADLDRLVDDAGEEDLHVMLTIEGERREMPPGVDLSAYRIVQEALTNVRKHAPRPVTAMVVMGFGQTWLDIEIADDGPGPQPGDRNGHGLIGMRERVAFFGGEFSAGARQGGGFVVKARFPLAPPEP